MMELFLPALTVMGAVFIMAPIIGLIPAALFLVLYLKLKRWPILVPAVLWVVYTIYEHLMKFRVLCSGECNIRVDLLVIYPLLLVLSIFAIVIVVIVVIGHKKSGKDL